MSWTLWRIDKDAVYVTDIVDAMDVMHMDATDATGPAMVLQSPMASNSA